MTLSRSERIYAKLAAHVIKERKQAASLKFSRLRTVDGYFMKASCWNPNATILDISKPIVCVHVYHLAKSAIITIAFHHHLPQPNNTNQHYFESCVFALLMYAH